MVDQNERSCPDCGADLNPDADPEVGDLLDCPNCGAVFEVVAVRPFTVAPFVDEEK